MNFKEFQLKISQPEPLSNNLTNDILGLVVELGELAQVINDKKDLTKDDLEENIYLAIRYCSLLSTNLNICLESLVNTSKEISPPKNIKQLTINLFINSAKISSIIKKSLKYENGEMSQIKKNKISESLSIILSDFNTLSQTVGSNIHDIIEKDYKTSLEVKNSQLMEIK